METFLSCDWGTSAFRLKLVNAVGPSVVSEISSGQGIANVYTQWKKEGTEERLAFYLAYLKESITTLEEKAKTSLRGLPLLMSGMATSTMGMMELPYKELPFSVRGEDLVVGKIKAGRDFAHDILLISGAKTENDVLRGEETQLVGCLLAPADGETLFIFPGTHSKHITVRDGMAVDFKTYMTGEFFALLSKNSILADSLEKGEGVGSVLNSKSFEKGVLDSVRENLLHSSFLVRTNYLFKFLSKEENYFYLSGLLIGTELKEVVNGTHKRVVIVGNELFNNHYHTALQLLNTSKESSFVQTQPAEEALIRGQLRIYRAAL